MLSFKSFLVTASLAGLAAAHVSLENPKPYKFVADGRTNPLMSDGSDFPCRIPKGQSYIIDGEPTDMTIGEDQFLSVNGHAVHGGGSCQIALSPGFPTKDSEWQVIHSIEGGCPARNQKGNLDGPNTDKYKYQIPEGIQPGGNWTLAFLWYNRIGGQPEVYMNCAPINIIASNKKRMSLPERRNALSKRHDDFPELFMANMGDVSNGCSTSEALNKQIAIAFPNPGSSIERNEDSLFKMHCDGNPRAKAPADGAGDDNDGKETETPSSLPASSSSSTSSSASKTLPLCPPLTPPAVTSSTAAATTATTPSTISSIPTTLSPVVSSVVSSASATLVAPSSTDEHASTTTLFPTPSVSTSALPTSSTAPQNPSVPSDGSPCVEGHLTCLDNGLFFATCTGGQLTAHQPIAPGYKCAPGSGVGLEISPM